MPFDAAFSDYNLERLQAADTLLLGRRSFQGSRDYWPPIADNPGQSPVEREISRLDKATEEVDRPGRARPRSSALLVAANQILARRQGMSSGSPSVSVIPAWP